MAMEWKGETLSTYGDLHHAQNKLEESERQDFLLAYAADLEDQGIVRPLSVARGNLAYLKGY